MNQRAYAAGAAIHTGTVVVGGAVGSFFKVVGTTVRDFAKGVKNGSRSSKAIVQRSMKRAQSRKR